MILGLTIPRLYSSWIATKVTANVKAPSIIEPSVTKNIFNKTTVKETLTEKTKDWMSGDDAESRKWLDQLIWNVML
jgi:hypothetical protein